MKEKKNEKDLSILDSQETEIATSEQEDVSIETKLEAIDKDIEEIKEKKKIKPWILIVTIVLIVAILAVGAFTWYQYTTLATYDGGRVTRAEFNRFYKATLVAEGVTEADITDVQLFKNNLLVALAKDEVFYKQLENLDAGQLTPEELTTIEQDAQDVLDNYVEQNLGSITATLAEGYSDKDLENAQEEFATSALNQIGCLEFQDFVNLRVKEEIFYGAYTNLLPDELIAPTDEELLAEYNKILDQQKAAYESNPAGYLYDAESISFPLYVPEGIRMIRHVLLKIDNDTLDEIAALKSEEKTEEADTLFEESLAALKPKAEEVLALLDAEEITFADAIVEYGEDTGMEYYPEGYQVCEGYDMYVPEFAEASLSIANVGDYTDLISTAYGYHIIEYFADMPSETVPYEDIHTNLYGTMLEANRSARWIELLSQWPIDLNLQFKDESLNEIDLY